MAEKIDCQAKYASRELKAYWKRRLTREERRASKVALVSRPEDCGRIEARLTKGWAG
jgi:hypothetical protein